MTTKDRSVEEKTLTDPNAPVEFTCPKCKADTDITFIIENERKIVAQAERQKREEVVKAERERIVQIVMNTFRASSENYEALEKFRQALIQPNNNK